MTWLPSPPTTCLYCRVDVSDGSPEEYGMCPEKKMKEPHTPWDYNPNTGKGMKGDEKRKEEM